jgi:hypothetical protein
MLADPSLHMPRNFNPDGVMWETKVDLRSCSTHDTADSASVLKMTNDLLLLSMTTPIHPCPTSQLWLQEKRDGNVVKGSSTIFIHGLLKHHELSQKMELIGAGWHVISARLA